MGDIQMLSAPNETMPWVRIQKAGIVGFFLDAKNESVELSSPFPGELRSAIPQRCSTRGCFFD